MSLTKENLLEIFDGYLLNSECPLRINLPKSILF